MCRKVLLAISLNPDAEAQAARVVETRNHRKKSCDEDDDNNGVGVGGHSGVGHGGDLTSHGMNDNSKCKSSVDVRVFVCPESIAHTKANNNKATTT